MSLAKKIESLIKTRIEIDRMNFALCGEEEYLAKETLKKEAKEEIINLLQNA